MQGFKKIILIFFMAYAVNGLAFNQSKIINCDYNFKNSSLMFSVGTLKKSVTLTRKYENLTYKIFISDINNPSEANDFITIKNKKGHKITYSLRCK